MEEKTLGRVESVSKQWWFKVNTKPIRFGILDGAIFPHIIEVKYSVNGKDYFKRKWISPGIYVPPINSTVSVIYQKENPKRAKIL